MALPSYFSLKGAKQGQIDGSCDIKGHEKKILVQGHEHKIDIPVSLQTGLATGKRVHHPFIIRKSVDASSPKIQQALTTGETITEALLEFTHIDKNGQEVVYFTKKIENAVVISVEHETQNILDPDFTKYPTWEIVALTYGKITTTWKDGGIEAVDSWTGQ
jgi:type VI secretion system secreted protein Hcp